VKGEQRTKGADEKKEEKTIYFAVVLPEGLVPSAAALLLLWREEVTPVVLGNEFIPLLGLQHRHFYLKPNNISVSLSSLLTASQPLSSVSNHEC